MSDLGAVPVPFARFAHFLAGRNVFLHRGVEFVLHAPLYREYPDVADRARFFLVPICQCIDRKQQCHEADDTAGQFHVSHSEPPLQDVVIRSPLQGLSCTASTSIGQSPRNLGSDLDKLLMFGIFLTERGLENGLNRQYCTWKSGPAGHRTDKASHTGRFLTAKTRF